jgi:hypothetical protein
VLALVAVVLGVVAVLLVHALGRYAFARMARLPIGRRHLGVFVPIVDRPGSAGARAGALVAGSAAAYLGVAALAFGYFSCHGVPTDVRVIAVAKVIPGSAAEGKLTPGDRILAVDGEPLRPDRGLSLSARVAAKEGAPVTLTILREGRVLDVEVRPRSIEARGRAKLLLGIELTAPPVVDTSAAAAASVAIRLPLAQLSALATHDLAAVAALFRGGDDADPGGPVRIVEEFRRSFEASAQFLWLLALAGAGYTLFVLVGLDVLALVGLGRRRARHRPVAG